MAISSLLTLVIIYAGLNILAFAVFIWDKLRAKVKMGRISETSLLLLAALGPAGALTGDGGVPAQDPSCEILPCTGFFILHVLLVVWLWPQISG